MQFQLNEKVKRVGYNWHGEDVNLLKDEKGVEGLYLRLYIVFKLYVASQRPPPFFCRVIRLNPIYRSTIPATTVRLLTPRSSTSRAGYSSSNPEQGSLSIHRRLQGLLIGERSQFYGQSQQLWGRFI